MPIDQGARQDTPTGRKLRPITLAEVLVKFSESEGLDEQMTEIKAKMEPAQLGVGTPEGNILVLRMLQAWASDMEDDNSRCLLENDLEALQSIIALDLTNAYGLFFRSKTIDTVAREFPELAGMVRSQWQNGKTVFWQRVGGRWERYETYRGGFQGLRLITVLFCCSLVAPWHRHLQLYSCRSLLLPLGIRMTHIWSALYPTSPSYGQL